MMKKIGTIVIAAAMVGCFILPVTADSDYTTITMDLQDDGAIEVDPQTWDLSGAAGSIQSTTFWLNNTGNVTMAVEVETNETTDSGDWTLNETGISAHNTYYIQHQYDGNTWVNVTNTSTTIDGALSPEDGSDSTEFSMRVGLPPTVSTNVQQTTRVTFTATPN